MNHRVGPHHKIWTPGLNGQTVCRGAFAASQRRSDAGYTLVALLAVMTVVALFAMAAAPGIRQQAQREREIETIFRGEQVAEAIRVYFSYQQRKVGNTDPTAALPTSIDQLLEGVPSGTKKIQILRASAARDPLSASHEWRLIRPRSSGMADFQRSLLLYAENVKPPTNDPQLKLVETFMAPTVLPTLGITTTGVSSADEDNSSGPFIGAASRSKNNSIIYYYGIDRHDGWIFTPLFR
jgi:type II secretory pathway pseudopilin PulG